MKKIKSQTWQINVTYNDGIIWQDDNLTMEKAFSIYHNIIENDNDAISVDIIQSTTFE